MPTTSILALRYPALSDAPNAPQILQNLCADVETALTGGFVRKAAQTDRLSTTTLSDDPDLTIAVAASATYIVEAQLFYTSPSAADFKFQFTAPSGSSLRYSLQGPNSTAASLYTDDQSAAFDLAAAVTVSGLAASMVGVLCRGLLRTSTTAGNFRLQWAQNTSTASNTSLLVDSYIDVRRVR